MARTTTAHRRRRIEIPLRTGELVISCSMEGEAGAPLAGFPASGAVFSIFVAGVVARSFVTDGALNGVSTEAAGRTLSGMGAHAVRAGTSISVASVTSQTRCRAPADALCMDSVMPSAATRMSVALASSISMEIVDALRTIFEVMVLSPALASATDAVAQSLYFGFAEIDVRHPQQRGDGLLRRVAKVGTDNVSENIFARGLGRLGWIVYVARTILSVLDELLLAQNSQNRPHRRVRWRIREIGHYLGHCGSRPPVENVHNLRLPTRERGGCFVCLFRH